MSAPIDAPGPPRGPGKLPTRWIVTGLTLGLALLGLASVGALRSAGERDVVAHLARAPATRLVELSSGDSEGRRRRIELVDGVGSVPATIRYAPPELRTAPVVVVIGGLRTGRRAVDLVDPDLPFTVAAIDYAWTGPRTPNALDLLLRLPAVQRDLIRTAVALRDLARELEQDPRAGGGRVYLVGASLGAPIAAATAATVRPAGLVLLYGFANHEALLAHRLVSHVPSTAARNLIARAGAALTANWDAARTLPRLCGVSVLMVGSSDDRDVPRECSETLWNAACEPRRRIEIQGGHIRAGRDPKPLLESTSIAAAWIREMERGHRSGSGPGAM